MRLLLDTNVFLKWIGGDRLPRAVERVLTRQSNERLVSVVSAWEIAMKPKLGLGPGETEAGIAELGATLLPIRFKHLEELSSLPVYPDHGDPFDRLLISQALAEDASMVSSDQRFGAYKKLRLIWD